MTAQHPSRDEVPEEDRLEQQAPVEAPPPPDPEAIVDVSDTTAGALADQADEADEADRLEQRELVAGADERGLPARGVGARSGTASDRFGVRVRDVGCSRFCDWAGRRSSIQERSGNVSAVWTSSWAPRPSRTAVKKHRAEAAKTTSAISAVGESDGSEPVDIIGLDGGRVGGDLDGELVDRPVRGASAAPSGCSVMDRMVASSPQTSLRNFECAAVQ